MGDFFFYYLSSNLFRACDDRRFRRNKHPTVKFRSPFRYFALHHVTLRFHLEPLMIEFQIFETQLARDSEPIYFPHREAKKPSLINSWTKLLS